MIRDNHYYGHDEILRRYCGVRKPFPVPGLIQHGWTPGTANLQMRRSRRRMPKFVWSQRTLDNCRHQGIPNLVPIGSPFLYLPPQPAPAPAQPRSLLAIPFHGWEQEHVEGDFEQYARSLEEIQRDGFGPITVCLYWLEYEDPALRAVFQRRGWPVVTNGHRDGNPGFLLRQREWLLRHAAITSNRVATATFYALVCDRPFFLFGPTMGMKGPGGADDPAGAKFDAWQRRHFPQLTYERFDGTCHRAVGERELGMEFRREPADLLDLMHWAPRHCLHRLARPLRRVWWKIQGFEVWHCLLASSGDAPYTAHK